MSRTWLIRVWVCFICLILGSKVGAQPDDPSAHLLSLRVATYNIENAFDVYDDPYTRDETTPVKPRWEYEAIAKALKAIDADIVAIQEVENEPVLQALVQEYLPDMGYRVVAVPLTNDERGIKLGLISRFPVLSITSYRWQPLRYPESDRTWRFARDLLHARVQLPGPEARVLNVFVVHLKSKSSTEGDPKSQMWRTSEAIRIRQIIGQMLVANPDELILLMGDFNSEPHQPAFITLMAPLPDGSVLLHDSHALLPKEERTTYPSEKFPNSIIDYILASPAMYERLIPEGSRVISDPALTRGSDHNPITAEFRLTE